MAVGPDRDMPISGSIAPGSVRPYVEGLVAGLSKYGHSLGMDYEIDYRERSNLELKGKQLGESFGGGGDLIFGMSTTVVRAAKAAAPSTPIVGVVSDRKNEGFGSAKKITGISALRSQTAGQCFERFLATVPTLKQVHVLHKPGYKPSERSLKLVKAIAKKRGVAVKPVTVKTRYDIEKKVAALPKQSPKKPAGVFALPVDICISAARQIIDVAQTQKGLPVFFPIPDVVTSKPSSALGGHGVSQHQCGVLMAEYVHKILWQGADPASLTVKEVDDGMFDWVISSAVANSLNIKLPKVI
jgi:ABC-type uncharacterized transport system substrate-binding protein